MNLNLDKLYTLEQIIVRNGDSIKSVIIDADDKNCLDLVDSFELSRVIYCSLVSNNILVKKQIKKGTPAVYIKANNLIIFDGEEELPILAINRLVDNHQKVDLNSIKNQLLVAAVAFSCQIPFYIIRSVLCNYNIEMESFLKNQLISRRILLND